MKNLILWLLRLCIFDRRIGTKLALMSALFVIPMGVMLSFMVDNLNKTVIDFARQELRGNEYQRPLEDILDAVQRHQLAYLDDVVGRP